VNRALLAPLLAPMAAMGAAAGAAALVFYLQGRGARRAAAEEIALRNPFSLSAAVRFALLFAAVLLAVKLVEIRLPGRGFLAVSALAGLTDVDAITLSMAEWSRDGGEAGLAVRAIAVATLTNTAVKAGLAAFLGAPALRRRAVASAGAIAAAAALALVLARG
jgi:uncharacterized membrane protein (DUF4010 family)